MFNVFVGGVDCREPRDEEPEQMVRVRYILAFRDDWGASDHT